VFLLDRRLAGFRETALRLWQKNAVLARRWLLLLGAVAAATWSTWYYNASPTRITVAVGPPGSEREAFLKKVAQTFAEARKPVRLKLVPAKDAADAARLLEADKVQLAVVRSDEAKLADGRSLALVSRRAIVLVARASESVTGTPSQFSAGGLAGKRIAVAATLGGPNRALIARLLAHVGVDPGDSLTEVAPAQIPGTLASGRADIAVIVVDPAAAATRMLLAEIAKALSGAVAIGAPPAAEALPSIHRDVIPITLAAGVFGGAGPLPQEKVATVAITEELVADSDFSETTASLLVKALTESRGRLSGSASAYEVSLPPQDAVRRFMPHAGVALSASDKSTSFLETYSDQIWLGLFALGLIGSSLAGLGSWLGLWQPEPPDPTVAEMQALIAGIESAQAVADVDAAERRLREIAVLQLKHGGDRSEIGPGHPSRWYPIADTLARRRRDDLSRQRERGDC
jgi:TRAP-type uncharacterized transport system substrate-binding protein